MNTVRVILLNISQISESHRTIMSFLDEPDIDKADRFIKDEDRLIGVGRALSDGICQGAIYNIAVRDEYRGKGIGKLIVDQILSRLSGCNVVLYTHPKHIGLYEHWGFRRMHTSYAKFPQEEHYEQEGFFED